MAMMKVFNVAAELLKASGDIKVMLSEDNVNFSRFAGRLALDILSSVLSCKIEEFKLI